MKRGFSLLESVFLVSLTAIALLALVNLFFIFTTTNGYQQAVIATEGSASRAFGAFEATILPASNVLASRAFSGTTYTSSATTLVLKVPSIDSSGVALIGTYDYVVFYVSGTTLYQLTELGSGSARTAGRRILSTAVNTLSFTYPNPDFTRVDAVTIDLQTRTTYKDQVVPGRQTGTFYLRNHLAP
ncbi:MAG: hypothetical protein AAB442_00965 [Patescibacteria group bacterium]